MMMLERSDRENSALEIKTLPVLFTFLWEFRPSKRKDASSFPMHPGIKMLSNPDDNVPNPRKQSAVS